MSRAVKLWLISACLVLLCFVAYGPLWNNDFVDLDDDTYVTQNEWVRNGLSADGIAWAWGTSFHAGYWIPITWMSLQFDASLSGALDLGGESGISPAVVHGQNLVWHCATCVLVLIVLTRMTASVWPSAFVAALFAVHPLHVESVAWATERKDVLSAFFWMLTLLYYLRYVEQPSWGRNLAVLVPFTLGMLAKPMLVTLPFVMLLLDYWPLRRWGSLPPLDALNSDSADAVNVDAPPSFAQRGFWRLVLEKVPLFLLAVGASVLAVVSQGHATANIPLAYLSVASRLANATTSFVWYLDKTFCPTDLVLFYIHQMNNWTWPPVIISGSILLLITILALGLRRLAPWLIVGWLWFIGTLVPVIGLVQVGSQAMADRFVYVPHIGLFMALAWTAAALLRRFRVSAVGGWAMATLCLLALTYMTVNQVRYWKDSLTIWEHAIAAQPDNHRAHVNLARQLITKALATSDTKLLEQSVTHYEEGVRLSPGIPEYEYSYAVALSFRGSLPDLEEAIVHLRKALRAVPGQPETARTQADAAHNLGVTQRRLRKYDEAAETLRKAIKLSPGPGTVAEYGMALWELGRRDEAQQQWEAALHANPGQAEALHGMGLVYLQQGKNREAAKSIDAAVKADPTLVQAYSNLGVAAGRLNQWEAAIKLQDKALFLKRAYSDLPLFLRRMAFALNAINRRNDAARFYAESTRLQPDWRKSNLDTAWTLATSLKPTPGDAATAWELAAEACQAVAAPSAGDLDIQAAALSAAGRFDEAARMAREAMTLAEPEQAATIAKRLAIYEMKKPFIRDSK